MTPRQIELARHALGLENGQAESYRNHFCADPGHADYDDWMAMVQAGDARKLDWTFIQGQNVFKLLRPAAMYVLRPGEKLEDRWS